MSVQLFRAKDRVNSFCFLEKLKPLTAFFRSYSRAKIFKYLFDLLFGQFSPKLIKRLLPGCYRTLHFYYHLLPIFGGYLQTLFLESVNKHYDAEKIQFIWNECHLYGAQRTAKMVKELSGFYVKVGQVFATKPDLLPRQYVDALKFVFEDCHVTHYRKVQVLMKYQLGISVNTTFAEFTENPVASATIAQVHMGLLKISGTRVAIKVQHPRSAELMSSDIGNMLCVSQLMDALGLRPPFDNTGVLREYAHQVPKEFDFIRESDMLNSIGISMSHMDDKVGAPKSQPYLCSRKVLIMSLVVGENCDTAFGPASKYKSGKDKQRRSTEFCSTLFSSYGYQLFCIGAFHSDPHPGNIFVTKNGACAMLDFGQIKVLRDETQLLFARMIIALNLNSNESVKLMRQIGLKIERSSAEIEKLVAYLLFDTRMDIPEAKLSPLALELPPELRVVSLSKIGADIFMIIRIITMFRGILTAQGVDVHARSIWYPFAITVLYRNGEYARQNLDLNAMQNPKSLREQLQELSNWMQLRNLPFNRDALTPFAIAGIFNISDLHTQISSGKDELVNKVFRNFPEADKKRCMEFLQLH